MALNFKDKTLNCSTSSINSLMFGSSNSVASCYKEMSFDQVSVSGVVVGPYTIPYSSSGCDYFNWATAADNAAKAAGVNLLAYPHRIYVLPSNGCPYAGLGTVGGTLTQTWVLGYCGTPDVYGHEFGHNLGMNHASTPTSVQIVHPRNGAIIVDGMPISVIASDDVGVTKIEVWVNGVLKQTTGATSDSFVWQAAGIVGNLAQQIEAKAFDKVGHVSSMKITVYQLPPNPGFRRKRF